jgi:hypothetical protein
MAAGLQGGTVLVFGTGADATYGLKQSYTITDQVERAEGRGADGHVQSVQEYNNTKSLSLNYLELGTPTGGPAIGATFTFESDTWYVNSIAQNFTVDGFKSVDVDATNYPNLGT